MNQFFGIIVTVFCSVMASGGFWAYFQNKRKKNDSRTKVILGLGYDRIVTLGMKYISRGYVSRDEYENLYYYIYEPYKKLRPDDGTVKKIMQDVNNLPIKNVNLPL